MIAAARIARHMPAMRGIACLAGIPVTGADMRRCGSARAYGGPSERPAKGTTSLRLCGTAATVDIVSTDIMAGLTTP